MNPVYYDASYLLKLQILESGTIEVRAHADSALEIHTSHHGFAEIYSNDKHLLAAASLFGLRGVNVITLANSGQPDSTLGKPGS